MKPGRIRRIAESKTGAVGATDAAGVSPDLAKTACGISGGGKRTKPDLAVELGQRLGGKRSPGNCNSVWVVGGSADHRIFRR